MRAILTISLLIAVVLFNFNCRTQKSGKFVSREVYKSNDLIITQVAENSFEHTSFLQTNDFGKVPCNGLLVKSGDEVVIFDTPTTNEVSKDLIKWVKESLHSKINAIVPTHFHDDCLGGLEAFHERGITSYAYFKTIELAKENNLTVPQHAFPDSVVLKVGKEKAVAKFFGEGHTKDNVVGYFPSEQVLFGGCLIKESGATKGYLGDANVTDWSATVRKVKNEYPDIKTIIPGHGQYGNQKLLDYTIKLFAR